MGISIDLMPLDEMANKLDESIDSYLAKLFESEAIPPQIRNELKESIEKMKTVTQSPGAITGEDQKRIMEHIDINQVILIRCLPISTVMSCLIVKFQNILKVIDIGSIKGYDLILPNRSTI